MRFADFRSDTVTQPTSAMRDAMMAAALGDDVFGDDPTVNELQERAAELLGFEAGLFAPTGTMTNLIAMMAHANRGDEVLCGQQWHTYKWEAGGMAVLGSIQPQPLANNADGTIDVSLIEGAIKPDDPHFARTKVIVLENTTGGKLLPLQYQAEVKAVADKHDLIMHLDGARVFNAATAVAQQTNTNVYDAVRDVVKGFHSVSVCLSKGLGAPVGSVLLGENAFIARGRRIRKMLGGGMRQAGVLCGAGLYALNNNVERLVEDHAHAEALAAGLSRAAMANTSIGDRLKVSGPNTNMVFTDIDHSIGDAFLAHLYSSGIGITSSLYGTGAYRLRWVTHLDIAADDIERACAAVASFRP